MDAPPAAEILAWRARQVEAARGAVLAVPGHDAAVLAVSGGDRVTWLNGLVTCDLVKRAEGEAVYGLVVARSGRVIADAAFVVDGERAFVVVLAGLAEGLRAHMEHHLVMEDAEVAVAALEAWALHGPRSDGALGAALAAGGAGGRLDRTGLGGAIVVAPEGRAAAVREAIEGAVAAAGGVIGDAGGWETLRLERAVPRFGVDFDDKTYPQEASLEKAAVSFSKGCYLGQEVVCTLEMRGHVKRKLSALVFESPAPPPPHAEVVDDAGAPVGEVTSAVASPTLGAPVGLAMLKRAYAREGAAVVVGGARAKVVARPA